MATELSNLPGVEANLKDQGLAVQPPVRGLRTLILGTAGQGQSLWPYVVGSTSTAASAFGSTGTLTRGMWEVQNGGAENVILYRIGATAAKLEHVGDSTGVDGYTIETLRRDDDTGGIYTIYYDDASDRLVVWNSQSGLTVYDNDDDDSIDLGEVIVSGERASGGGPDIAGPSLGMAMEDIVGAGHAGIVFTAGTDGSNPSRMELYEYLHAAYKSLLGKDFDFVVPMDVYLDDKNIVDGYAFTSSFLSGLSGSDYPTPSSSNDILGKVFIEEYAGKDYFFWDLDGDGEAEIYPSVGSGSATTKINGDPLSTADFHEVNFGYQCAEFCYEISFNSKFCLGVIGMRPPSSLALEDLSAWVGKTPTYTTRSDGSRYIARVQDNGTGLLGNKFMAGKYGFRAGVAYGGLILTDSRFLDGVEQTDSGDEYIDIGKYLSIVASYIRLFNAFDSTGRGYVASFAPTYLGFVASLDEQRAPTNKVVRGVRRIMELGERKVNELAGMGYVHIYEKPKGMTVADAPTGARPMSDYRRLTTIRIVKRAVAAIRAAADPFLGNSFDAARKAALRNAMVTRLDKLVQGGYIQRHELSIKQTSAQKVLGTADVELIIVPAWELRKITLTVALQPQ